MYSRDNKGSDGRLHN